MVRLRLAAPEPQGVTQPLDRARRIVDQQGVSFGREAFEARVWEWVKQSHGTITGQMRKLGESVDWSRERFTLDEQLSRAVRRVFVSLYHEGLIYRGAYIVNWCPRCRTALSDLEVVHKDSTGKLWYVRYPGADGGEGVVLRREAGGVAVVRFAGDGSERRLMLDYAPLENL